MRFGKEMSSTRSILWFRVILNSLGRLKQSLSLTRRRSNGFAHSQASTQVLTLCGKGMLIGDSDVLNDQNFTFSLKCVSQKGALLVMTKQQFLSIRSKNHAWMNICLEAYNKQQIHEYQDSALKESHLML
jgi:hypothetical protein